MRSKFAKAVLITAALAVSAGCSSGGAGGGLSADDVKGTWIRDLSDGTETLTLNSDMTYKKIIELTSYPPISSETQDTYSLSGDKIQINYSDFGTVSEYTVAIDGNTMKWDNGSAVLEYKKK